MSIFYGLGKNPVRLFIISQTLLLIAFVWRDFPIFIFFAFAPMFALIDHPTALRDSYLPFLVALGTAFIFYYTMQESMHQSSVLSWIIYFTFLAMVFTAYVLMQRWAKNRLNKFALVIFILGMEYIFLKMMTHTNPVFLADLLKYKTSWTRWNIFTGYTGATLWILLTNLLFYQALFKQEKVNWALCGAAFLIILLPLVYSLTNHENSLVKADVINYYTTGIENNSSYAERGELISRTGAWVSPLIIIFTLVMGMTKKESR
jgi:apolipoprotein N-acyltransferase